MLCFSTQNALVIQGADDDEQAKDLQDVVSLPIDLAANIFLNWPGSDLVSLLFWDIARSYSKKDEWLWYTLLLHSLTQVAQDIQSSYRWLPQRSLMQYGKSVFRPCWQCAVDLFYGQGCSWVGWRSPPPPPLFLRFLQSVSLLVLDLRAGGSCGSCGPDNAVARKSRSLDVDAVGLFTRF